MALPDPTTLDGLAAALERHDPDYTSAGTAIGTFDGTFCNRCGAVVAWFS